MTDFSRWERFDADEAENEVDRQAEADTAIRERVSLEQRVLKECEERAAILKSEAAVRSLKAKRGLRRRGTDRRSYDASSSTNPGAPRAGANTPTVCETPTNGNAVDLSEGVCRAQASADEAGAIVRGLRKGLGLRDVVLASAEAGELYKAVTKARECITELGAVQNLLQTKSPAAWNQGHPPPVAAGDSERCDGEGAGGSEDLSHDIRACDHGHSHSHSHSHLGHGTDSSETHVGKGDTDDSGEKVSDGGDRNAVKAKEGDLPDAVEVVRRAKLAVRMAEGTSLFRAGRAAQSTEAFRDLLLENPNTVEAWTMRGRAFLLMQNQLLAGLHFDRALEIDLNYADAVELKKSLCFSPDTDKTGGSITGMAKSPHSSSKSPFDQDDARSRTGYGGKEGAALCAVEGGESTAQAYSANKVGALKEKAFRRSLAAVCEQYRAGVVFHQEAFFASSRDKFCRVLSMIDEAEETIGFVMQGNKLSGEEGSHGYKGVRVHESTERGGGCSSATEVAALPIEKLKKVLDEVRVGCHLNIAAAALLRKVDYESVVHHCTRAIEIQPRSSSRALVRRAQANEELGRFGLCINDLEAAEALILGDAQEVHPRGESKGLALALAEELAEIRKRLERARWTKIHVGNGKDELPRVGGGRALADDA